MPTVDDYYTSLKNELATLRASGATLSDYENFIKNAAAGPNNVTMPGTDGGVLYSKQVDGASAHQMAVASCDVRGLFSAHPRHSIRRSFERGRML